MMTKSLLAGAATFALLAFPSFADLPTNAGVSVGNLPVTTPAGYYISATGSDSNNGLTPLAPILTFSHGLTLMRGGLKYLYVMSAGGTFAQGSVVNLTNSDNGETILANGTDLPVLDGGGTLTSIFTETSAQSVRFQGLTFQNTAVGRAAIILNSGNNNTVIASTFTNVGQAVLVEGEVLSKILGNQVTNVLGDATGGTSPGSCTFPGGATGLNCNGSAFELQGNGTIPSSQITVSGNVVNGTNGQSTHGGAVYAHGLTGSTITYNDVENTVGMGIGIVDFSTSTEDSNNVVAYNRLLNTNTNSGDSGCVYTSGRFLPVQNSTFMFNICAQGSLVNTASNNIRDWYNDDCASNNSWHDNISWGFGNGSSGSGGSAAEIHVGSNVSFANMIFGKMATNANQIILIQSTGGSGSCSTAMAGNTMTNIVGTSSKTTAVFATTFSGDTPNLTATNQTLFGQGVTTTWSSNLGAGSGVTITGQTTLTNPGLSATFGLKVSGNVMITDNFTLSNAPAGFNQIPTSQTGTPGYSGLRARYAY